MTEEQETNRRIISQTVYSYNQKKKEADKKFHEFDEAYGRQVLTIAEEIEPYVYCKNQNSYYCGPWGKHIHRSYSLDENTVYIEWSCYGGGESEQGNYNFPLEFLWNSEAIQAFKDDKTKEMTAAESADKQKQLEEKKSQINWLKKQVEEIEKSLE